MHIHYRPIHQSRQPEIDTGHLSVIAMPMYDEIPCAMGGVNKAFEGGGGYQRLQHPLNYYRDFDAAPPVPPVPSDRPPAPPVKPKPKPRKPADDDDYLHFSSNM